MLQQSGEAVALQAFTLTQQGRVELLGGSLAMMADRLYYELKRPEASSVMLTTARQFENVLWAETGTTKRRGC